MGSCSRFQNRNYQSIQELNKQVQQQQAMIEALKKDNEELKTLLKKLIEKN